MNNIRYVLKYLSESFYIIVLLCIIIFQGGCGASSSSSSPSQISSLTFNSSFINPYQPTKSSFKGSTHIHTSNSDGQKSAIEVASAYRNAGFDFIVITDHDVMTTAAAIPGLLLINGVEESAIEGHIVTINPPYSAASLYGQTIVDDTVTSGGIAILAHPNYSTAGFSVEELENISDYSAIEVFNQLVQWKEGHGNAEDKWDAILSKGRIVFGVASDDMHALDANHGFNGGWIKVFADSLTVRDILQSLKTGNFIASSGPDLAISVKEKTIIASTDFAANIEFISNGGRVIFSKNQSTEASYSLIGGEGYVRVRVTRNSDGKKAWSNPIFYQ